MPAPSAEPPGSRLTKGNSSPPRFSDNPARHTANDLYLPIGNLHVFPSRASRKARGIAEWRSRKILARGGRLRHPFSGSNSYLAASVECSAGFIPLSVVGTTDFEPCIADSGNGRSSTAPASTSARRTLLRRAVLVLKINSPAGSQRGTSRFLLALCTQHIGGTDVISGCGGCLYAQNQPFCGVAV